MTGSEETRLRNLIAKQAKWRDKFTKADATTLQRLQAKKQSEADGDGPATLASALGRCGSGRRANPKMTAGPDAPISVSPELDRVAASLELLALRAKVRPRAVRSASPKDVASKLI